jgi:hypothetical protein
MTSSRRLIAIPVVASVLYAAGCKKETAAPTLDPTAMVTGVNGLNATFSQNAVFQSLSALSGVFTLSAPVVRPEPPVAPTEAAWPQSAASALAEMRRLGGRAPTAIQALFPVNVLGKTFQWDTASGGKYRIMDSTLAGAPANGVRFRLYQADTLTGKPHLPLTTTGFVDLIDVSTTQANALHILLYVGTQTAADYTITEVKTTTSLTLSATGYVKDVVAGGAPANFTLTHALTLADSSLVTDYSLKGTSATVTMHTAISGAGGSNVSLDWIIQTNGSLEIVGTSTPSTINFQFKFNGAVWASMVGNLSNPVISGANGQQLTAAQLIALGQILAGFGDIASSLAGVFRPSYLVFK